MRVAERKRKPFMTARKWTILALFTVILIITLIAIFYSRIQEDYWHEQHYVKSSLREQLVYSTIDYAEKYVWDESYWIVKGKTILDTEKYIVWKDLSIVHSSPVDELLSEQQFIAKLKDANADLVINHIQPAFFRGELCFEVQTKSESNHTVFTFYAMTDSRQIDQFTLPH